MYYLTGMYSFKEDLTVILKMLKDEIDSLIFKIYELDRVLHG